jgi:hypothetical protein
VSRRKGKTKSKINRSLLLDNDNIVDTYNLEPYNQYLAGFANTNGKLFHITLNLNPIKFKNADFPSTSIRNIRDIHAMDIEDVIRLLHEYEQDVEKECRQ